MEGSEEVYDFLVCAIAPTDEEYEPEEPEFGFLFPAFKDRSRDTDRINIFHADPEREKTAIVSKILGR